MPDSANASQEIPRKVAASQGFRWVIEGVRLYRKNPLLLSAAFALLFGGVMALNLIPAVGGALSEVVSPLLAAGFLAAYRALDSDQELELPHFLAGVGGSLQPGAFATSPALPLMTLGAVQLLGTLIIGQVMRNMGFDAEALLAAAQKDQPNPDELQALLNQTLPAAFTGLVLFTPLIMATWFAPALVLFGGARPTTALAVSLKAVTRNWAALAVNGLTLGMLLFVAALIPLLLGLLVALPVLLGSLYASYQAIFAVWADDAASVEPSLEPPSAD
jgi:hypothetical protein